MEVEFPLVYFGELISSVFHYLDQNGTFTKCNELVLDQKASKGSPLMVSLDVNINILDALQNSPTLAQFLLDHHLQFHSLVEDLLFGLINFWTKSPRHPCPFDLILSDVRLISTFVGAPSAIWSKEICDLVEKIAKKYSRKFVKTEDPSRLQHCLPEFEDHLDIQSSYSMYLDEETNKSTEIGNISKERIKFVPNIQNDDPEFEFNDANRESGKEVITDFDLCCSSSLQEFSINPNSDEIGQTLNVDFKSQLQIHLSLDGIPNISPWTIKSAKDLTRYNNPQVAVVRGTLIAYTLPVSYIVAGEVMREQENLLVRVELEDEELTEGRRSFYVNRMVTLEHRESDRSLIRLGHRFESSVIVVPKSGRKRTLKTSKVYQHSRARNVFQQTPKLIRELQEDRVSSPWSFVLTLAFMFCSDVAPPGTYHKLKMALLLSLVSCSTDESVLAVLGVGKDDLIQMRLMKAAAALAPRTVIHSSLNDFEGRAYKDANGDTWVESGTILKASGGVAIIEDLAFIKKELKTSICNVLENEKVQIGVPSPVKGSSIVTFPLRACLWSVYNPCHKRTRMPDEEMANFQVPVGDLTKSVSAVFGLVVYSDLTDQERNDEFMNVLCNDTLLSNVMWPSAKRPLISNEDIIQYLNKARLIDVSFTKESEDLLRGYYVAIRRLQGECNQGSQMPITAITTLSKVAKCHTKLSLRSRVLEEDAAAAISLSEEAMTARTGVPLLGMTPYPHLPSGLDLHYILGRKNDERMYQFTRKLKLFIEEHTGDIII